MTSTCAYEVVDDLRQIVPEIIRGSVSWMYSSCDVPAKIDDTARRIHDTCEAITASVVSPLLVPPGLPVGGGSSTHAHR